MGIKIKVEYKFGAVMLKNDFETQGGQKINSKNKAQIIKGKINNWRKGGSEI